MSPRLARILGGVRQVVLTVGAVVGVVCILLTLAALVLGVRPLVFRSGSMSPTIGTGALAIAHRVDASSLATGQIVSVPTKSGERVTHRIQAVQHDGDRAVLVLKGDANKVADASPHVVDHADKVLFSVPWLGYVVGWLTGQVGLFLLGLYAAFLLSVMVRPTKEQPRDRPRGGSGGKRSSGERSGGTRVAGKRVARRRSGSVVHGAAPVSTLVLVLGLVSGGVVQWRTTPTLAAWTDPGAVSGTTVTAYTVPAPPNTTCTVVAAVNDIRGVDLSWPTVTAVPLSYDAAMSGVTPSPPEDPTASSSGGTTTLQIRYDSSTAPTNTFGTVTAVAHPTAAAAASWMSPTSTWKFKTGKATSSQPSCQELVAPALTITAPAAGNQAHATKASAVKTACGKKYMLCGTVSDDSGIAAVEFILQKGTTCWQDSTNNYTSDCATWQQADTAASWSDTNNSQNIADSAYGTAGSYTLTVRATDEWANVTTVVRTFTLT